MKSIRYSVLFIYKLTKTFWFLLTIIFFLSTSSLLLLKQVSHLSTQLAMTATALKTLTASHKKDIQRMIAKERAKARLKRSIVAIPVLGTIAFTAFEVAEYNDWKKINPEKNKNDYLCENATVTMEIIDEVFKEIPEKDILKEKAVSSLTSNCRK